MPVCKIYRRYIVKVVNPNTGVNYFASSGPCPYFFSLTPRDHFSFKEACRIAALLKRFYPIVRLVAFDG